MDRLVGHRTGTFTKVVLARLLGVGLFALTLAACDQDVTEDPDDGEVGEIEVVYGDVTVTVDLADLEAVTLDDGDAYARLSDIVVAADLGVDLETLEYDFEATDGYRPSGRSTCAGVVPVSWEVLQGGYVHRTNQNLAWDEALEMPGCAYVDEARRIHVLGAGTLRRTVEVEYGDDVTTVDLRDLERIDIDGVPSVRLDHIVDAADLGVAIARLGFDFVAGDGYRPSDSGNCADAVPVAGADLHLGALSFEGMHLTWDEPADFPGCLNVDDVVRIVAIDDEITGQTIEVRYLGESITVDLDDAEVVTFESTPHVHASDVLALAALGVDPAGLVVDLEASDGFRPSENAICSASFPIAATSLSDGFIATDSRNIAWEPVLGMPGCAFVDDVAIFHVTNADTGDGPFVDVTFDGESVTIDLSTLDAVSFLGAPNVSLLDIVEAAELGVATTDLGFDFVASDGYRASDSPSCTETVPVPGDALDGGRVSLETSDLEWTEASGMPGCVAVNTLVEIVAEVL